MTRYACREDNGQLKIPPAGSDRSWFCAECPSGPYKGENCLFGHSAETQYIIHCVSVRMMQERAWERGILADRFCPVCGLPMPSGSSGLMHRHCWARVISRERVYHNLGLAVPREDVVQELAEA